MSLRGRLLIGLVVLTTAGLAVAGIVTYAAERSFLVSRVDQQFSTPRDQRLRGLRRRSARPAQGSPRRAGTGGAQPFPNGPRGPGGRGPGGTLTGLPLGTIGIHVAANGTASRPVEFEGSGASTPKLDVADVPADTAGEAPHPRLVTVDSEAGSALQYRVLKKPSDTGHGTLIIAVPLSDVSQTLTRLRNVELIVIAAVVLALAALRLAADPPGAAPAHPHRRDGRGDRRRRSLAPRQPRGLPHRGGSPGPCAQRDARPDRARLRRAPGERGPPAALPLRRLARAAHAADLDPRLCRALPHRRGGQPAGHGEGDGAHRGGGREDGRARRGPARPRAPGRDAADEPRAGGDRAAAARRCRRRARRRPRPRRHGGRDRRRRSSAATPPSCARCSPT